MTGLTDGCETRKITKSGVEIETVRGDIAEVQADAIVNAANSELWMGSGVAGAIKRKGGASIEREAISMGPIEVGEAVATSAGALRAKWVIHAAAMGPDLRTDGEKIGSATKSALRVAKDLRAECVALPSLGTGVGGFPVEKAAEIMVHRALDHASKSAFPRRIIFVLFTEEAKRVFDTVLAKVAR